MNELLTLVVPEESSDEEAVRCIYSWICNNIKYDTVSWRQKITQIKDDISVDHILQTKMATCKGFATLFAAMCR